MKRTCYYIGIMFSMLGAMSTVGYIEESGVKDGRIIIAIVLFLIGLILFFSNLKEGEKIENELFEEDMRRTGGSHYRKPDDYFR